MLGDHGGPLLPGPGWGWHLGGRRLEKKPAPQPSTGSLDRARLYGFKSAFGKMVTHGPIEIGPFLSPQRVICFATQGRVTAE